MDLLTAYTLLIMAEIVSDGDFALYKLINDSSSDIKF